MKMFNKNGNFTIVAQIIFNENLRRLRAGDSPASIIVSLNEQLRLIRPEGILVE